MPGASQGLTIVNEGQVRPNTVNNAALQDDAVRAAEIQAGAVGTSEIADGTIVNDDIKSDAAIADTKLAQITTPSKVSGAALTLLGSIPAGAGVIPAANLPGSSDPEVFVAAGIAPTASNVTRNTVGVDASFPVLVFADAATAATYFSARVPSGKTTISSIKIIYWNAVASKVVRLNSCRITRYRIDGSAETTDADATNDDISTGATINRLEVFTFPGARFGAISAVAAGDIIALDLQRAGSDGADTYNAAWAVAGVLFTFA